MEKMSRKSPGKIGDKNPTRLFLFRGVSGVFSKNWGVMIAALNGWGKKSLDLRRRSGLEPSHRVEDFDRDYTKT